MENSKIKKSNGISRNSFDVRVGNAIRELRKLNNLNQCEFAKSDDLTERICSAKTLGRIERGEISPQINTINELLLANDITFEEFARILAQKDKPA